MFPVEYDQYTSDRLLAIQTDERQIISTNVWRMFLKPSMVYMSDQREIRFDKIDKTRRIAPFAVPHMPGRPIYREEGSEIRTFAPAYVKPKDAVVPGDHMSMTGDEVVRRVGLMSPQQRFDRRVIEITRFHRDSIERLKDWMHAVATKNAAVPIGYMTDDGVRKMRVIHYGRKDSHTILADTPNYVDWADSNTDLFDIINRDIDAVADSEFGGRVTDLLLGSKAARAFIKYFDSGPGKAKLNRDYRGSEEVMVRRGLIRTDPMNPFTYLGSLDPDLQVWKVSGVGNQFQNDDNSFTTIMNEWDALYIAPGANLIMAYGAIQEVGMMVPTPMYPKMWVEQDPSGMYIMTQSAPLAIVQNPNCTLHRVVGKA